MKKVNLPTEKAHEPAEEAHQPVCIIDSNSTISSQGEANKMKKLHATFAENVKSAEKELSQSSSAYKEALSQPSPDTSHRLRLSWLQKRRGSGLWVQCDACSSWRYLPHVLDSHQLPSKWYCSMNPDKSLANCSAPEAPLRIAEEEDLIHSEYSAGSLVWARLPGWPWWPAMVDDCPDTEQFYWLDGFSDIPTHYNVVFFDIKNATRAWISPENLKPYTANKNEFHRLLNSKKYKTRLEKAVQTANEAEQLPVAERLARFSFLSTYKGPIVSPKQVSKLELERFQKKLKRKFNVEFPIEVSSESEDETVLAFRESNKKKNVIIIGTSKGSGIEQAKSTDEGNGNLMVNDETESISNKDSKNNEESYLNVINCNNTQQDWAINTGNINYKFKTPQMAPIEVVKNGTEFSVDSTDSMNNEIGSTQQSINMGSENKGIDDDSSKTYIPEDESDAEVNMQEFQVRVETPSSDDFDF